jgi:hypothetical protein
LNAINPLSGSVKVARADIDAINLTRYDFRGEPSHVVRSSMPLLKPWFADAAQIRLDVPASALVEQILHFLSSRISGEI